MRSVSQKRTAAMRHDTKWTDEDDMKLLEAMSLYGFGNWEDVAKRIGSKTPEDAKERYISCFLNGPIGQATWNDVQSESLLVDHFGKSTDSDTPVPCDFKLTAEELTRLGYMPECDHYKYPYDPEAERMICNLIVKPDDDDLDITLKMSLICAYNRRLSERRRWERVARTHGLPEVFFQQEDTPQTPGIVSRIDKMRIFAQIMTKEEFKTFITNLRGERDAWQRLKYLYRYRRHGVTRFDECEHFEQQFAMRRRRNPAVRRSSRTTKDNHSDSPYIYG